MNNLTISYVIFHFFVLFWFAYDKVSCLYVLSVVIMKKKMEKMGIYQFLRLKNTDASSFLLLIHAVAISFFRQSIMLCVIHSIVQFFVVAVHSEQLLVSAALYDTSFV